MVFKKSKKVKVYNTKKKGPSESKIIEDLQSQYDKIDETKVTKFSDFPLSQKTLKGLKENNYIDCTDIQRQSIGLALRGFDILGAAKTGSGKTLAFLIPILESLYCKQWTRVDGVGAIVITPTRELAYQIYETLRKIGHYHDISAGLIIGGKDLNFERKRMDQCNIIICTPGRLLQHMDTNPLFDCVTMQILVLDEADRCLDMGFEKTMNSIIENLPPKRQTLLFSATQTRSVRDLARLSLKDPKYISVHENATHATPDGLQQSYIVCELEDKVAMLWSFIRNHLKQKIIVFFSSCKQVKYMFEAFCRLRPGLSLLALYGTLHQLRRMNIYETFCKKQHAVLFATDIAARGLDFPAVNWVVQMDCPEDTNAYIHRAGRTARFQKGGESLLVLLPSEVKMVEKLAERKVPIDMIQVNSMRLQSPHRKLEALLARDVALKESAQRAFIAYIKSVFLMKDKEIFDVHSLNTDAFAQSLGLAIPPRIRFLQRAQKKLAGKEKNGTVKIGKDAKISESIVESSADSENEDKSDSGSEEANDRENKRKADRQSTNAFVDDFSDEEDILTIKRKNIEIDDVVDETLEDINDSMNKKKFVTKAAVAKKILRKKIKPNKKITFDDEGQEVLDPVKSKLSEFARKYENEIESGINIEVAKQVLREEDRYDKQLFRDKVKQKHKEEKRKLKALKKAEAKSESDEEEPPKLGGREDSEDESDEPDTSWLPDPDKIYGAQNPEDEGSPGAELSENQSDEDEDEDEEEEEEGKEADIHRPPKRKLMTQKEHQRTLKKQKILELASDDHLKADEELALQLLQR